MAATEIKHRKNILPRRIILVSIRMPWEDAVRQGQENNRNTSKDDSGYALGLPSLRGYPRDKVLHKAGDAYDANVRCRRLGLPPLAPGDPYFSF